MDRRFVLFGLAGRTFCLPADDVREVFALPALTPLTHPSPLVRGAVNLRGELLPIVDLRAAFHLPARPDQPRDVVIAVTAGERAAGVIAEELGDLVAFADDTIQPAVSPAAPFTSATIADGPSLHSVLDLGQLARLVAA